MDELYTVVVLVGIGVVVAHNVLCKYRNKRPCHRVDLYKYACAACGGRFNKSGVCRSCGLKGYVSREREPFIELPVSGECDKFEQFVNTDRRIVDDGRR